MAETTRITVPLPTELVTELKRLTDDVPGFVAEAVAARVRRLLLRAELDRYEEEHGAFTEEELEAARARINEVLSGDPHESGSADR